MDAEEKKLHDSILNRNESLEQVRDTNIDKWREVSRFVEPTLGEFEAEERDDGSKKHNYIINSTATSALNIAVAGMLAGAMSPNRPWFKLEPDQPGVDQSPAVRIWMEQVRQLLLDIFNESTLYQAAPSTLAHGLGFGNGLTEHLDDFENVAFFRDIPTGSYVWAQNDKGIIDTVGLKRHYSAQQLIKKFGIDMMPENIKQAAQNNHMKQDYEVLRWVEPNADYNPTKAMSQYKKFAAFYILLDGDKSKNVFLRKSGHDEFPFHPLRWDVKGSDVYASSSPGLRSLGDVKQLQATEKQKARALQKMVDPPLQGPATLQGKPVSGMAGSMTLFHGGGQAEKGLRPVYTVQPPIQEIRQDLDAIERRIGESWFTDLFFAISRMEGIQPKNMLELTQRNQERLLQLGPVLLRLHREYLGGIIARTFNQCARAGILPPPPPEIENTGLKIRYISTMALAQQAAETDSIDRMIEFVGRMGAIGLGGAMDMIDADAMTEKYATVIGVPADIIRSAEDVAADRESRARQQAAAMMADMANKGASATKQLADANLEGDNALTRMTGNS